MLTFCAEAGRLSAAIANNDNTVIQAGRIAVADFLVLNMLLSSEFVELLPATLRPPTRCCHKHPNSIQAGPQSCLSEVTMLSKVVDNYPEWKFCGRLDDTDRRAIVLLSGKLAGS